MLAFVFGPQRHPIVYSTAAAVVVAVALLGGWRPSAPPVDDGNLGCGFDLLERFHIPWSNFPSSGLNNYTKHGDGWLAMSPEVITREWG